MFQEHCPIQCPHLRLDTQWVASNHNQTHSTRGDPRYLLASAVPFESILTASLLDSPIRSQKPVCSLGLSVGRDSSVLANLCYTVPFHAANDSASSAHIIVVVCNADLRVIAV